MRRSLILVASALLVTSMLSGCLIVPAWDDGGGYGYHHHGYHHGYGRW